MRAVQLGSVWSVTSVNMFFFFIFFILNLVLLLSTSADPHPRQRQPPRSVRSAPRFFLTTVIMPPPKIWMPNFPLRLRLKTPPQVKVPMPEVSNLLSYFQSSPPPTSFMNNTNNAHSTRTCINKQTTPKTARHRRRLQNKTSCFRNCSPDNKNRDYRVSPHRLWHRRHPCQLAQCYGAPSQRKHHHAAPRQGFQTLLC